MYHPDIDAWLQSRDDAERLKELERRAAEAWFESLLPAQQEVFAALSAGHGLTHLTSRFFEERLRAKLRKDVDAALGKK